MSRRWWHNADDVAIVAISVGIGAMFAGLAVAIVVMAVTGNG